MIVKFEAKTLGALAVALLLADGARADTADNPYTKIVARNLFGLKDPPPPPSPESLKPPPPAITLQGLTSMLGKNRVLFKVAMPAKPPQPASEVSKMLAEGDGEDEITVLEINIAERSVKFDNHGTVEVKNMKDHAAKPTGSPVTLAGGIPQPGLPQPIPAAAPQPAVGSGVSLSQPTDSGFSARAAGLQNIPPRPSRYGATTADSGTVVGSGTVGSGKVAATPNTPRTFGQNWPPERIVTREEQEIMIEVDRERNKGNPNYPPLPPTSITPNPTPSPKPQ